MAIFPPQNHLVCRHGRGPHLLQTPFVSAKATVHNKACPPDRMADDNQVVSCRIDQKAVKIQLGFKQTSFAHGMDKPKYVPVVFKQDGERFDASTTLKLRAMSQYELTVTSSDPFIGNSRLKICLGRRLNGPPLQEESFMVTDLWYHARNKLELQAKFTCEALVSTNSERIFLWVVVNIE
ncbi:hypothetical protein CYMTET_45222, partial [Cymbomonas tetramitiformis]